MARPNAKHTAEALEVSIAKWRMVEAGLGYDRGRRNCALCQLFRDQDCSGCPVKDATGIDGCQNTPYMKWLKLKSPDRVRASDYEYSYQAMTPKGRRIAGQMRKFLESLRAPT